MDRAPTKPYDFGRGGVHTKGIKFYHASPVRFHHGDLVLGGKGGGAGTGHPMVCMTTSPRPHGTIQNSIPGRAGHEVYDRDSAPVVDRDWFVYEVEPLGPVYYVSSNDEYQAKRATVVKNLGKAKAFLPKKLPSPDSPFKKEPDAIAHPPHVEVDRLKKQRERRERHQDRRDRRDLIEAAMVDRVVTAYLNRR